MADVELSAVELEAVELSAVELGSCLGEEDFWGADYKIVTVGSELLTDSGTDFFTNVEAPWTWDPGASDYNTNGGALGAAKFMQETGVGTVGSNYQLGLVVDDYVAGDLLLYAGADNGAVIDADGTYMQWLTQSTNQDYLVYGFADFNCGSVSGFTCREITAGAVDFAGMWTTFDSHVGCDDTGLYVKNGPSSSQVVAMFFRAANTLTADLVVGKTYTLGFDYITTHNNLDIRVHAGTDYVDYLNLAASGTWKSWSAPFVAQHATNAYFRVQGGAPDDVFYMQNFSLIG